MALLSSILSNDQRNEKQKRDFYGVANIAAGMPTHKNQYHVF